jgi:putative ABC transport system permease protein
MSARHGIAGTASEVPLAWRNLVVDTRRLVRSASGIAFAIVLMLIELGFRNAFVDAAVDIIRALDGDIVITSSAKYQFAKKAPFSRRQLYEARGVAGVASARPVYAEWTNSVWKNPDSHATYALQVFGFDPDQPVFLIPEIAARLAELRQPDAVMTDSRARSFLGRSAPGTESEFARTKIHVVGSFPLGPDFYTDGTLLMSDRNFLKLLGRFGPEPGGLLDPELGVVKVEPGYEVERVQRALRAALPANVAVLTKDEFVAQESRFQSQVSGVGPIFGVGTLIGFAVGMMISYQILHADISDQLPQYATLKAIGYGDRFLVKVVLQQAVFYGLVGFLPAWILTIALYRLLGAITLLPLRMTVGLSLTGLALTVGMCILSALVAVRRVIRADPAELF